VRLYASRPITEPGEGVFDPDAPVADAQVAIYDVEADTLIWLRYDAQPASERQGAYRHPGGATPQPGRHYRLEVSHTRLPAATATAYVPMLPHARADIAQPQGDARFALELMLSGAPDASYHSIGPVLDFSIRSTSPAWRVDHADDSAVRYLESWAFQIVNVYPLPSDSLDRVAIELRRHTERHGEPYLTVTSFSPDLHAALVSAARAQWTQGDALASPVRLYTNVDGGLGFFAGASQVHVPFRIAK
jgi:hypothetical protein